MARIRFTQPERADLLAKATIVALNEAEDLIAAKTRLQPLAGAFAAGEGREFDELLVEHFRDVALAALESQGD